jgi:S1-C subfamily serine protease
VLGILTTGLIGGVALAVPGTLAWRIAETLAKHGRLKRGYLGVSSQPVPLAPAQRAGRAQESGLLIVRVEEGSAAEQGGLLIGDILVGFAGQALNDPSELQAALAGDMAGKSVAVEVIRGGALQSLNVTVGERG